jgi:hypothetical protein
MIPLLTAGAMAAAGAPRLLFSGLFTTSTTGTPVTSATRTITGTGTLLFNNRNGILTALEYSKNGGAFATITEGLTLAMTTGDTLAVRSAIAISPNSTTFDIRNNATGVLIEAVTLERT